jgi:predicted anti-sigma-YlaC factor YlaD
MSWLHGLKSLLFLTCRDAVSLMSQAMDRNPESADRASLRMHLAICPGCRRYYGQLALLRRALLLVHAYPPRQGNHLLPPQARARIALGLGRAEGPN